MLIFTTAGKTFATAKTDGSEAGSAWEKEGVALAKTNRALMIRISAQLADRLGSARVSRAGDGISLSRTFHDL